MCWNQVLTTKSGIFCINLLKVLVWLLQCGLLKYIQIYTSNSIFPYLKNLDFKVKSKFLILISNSLFWYPKTFVILPLPCFPDMSDVISYHPPPFCSSTVSWIQVCSNTLSSLFFLIWIHQYSVFDTQLQNHHLIEALSDNSISAPPALKQSVEYFQLTPIIHLLNWEFFKVSNI